MGRWEGRKAMKQVFIFIQWGPTPTGVRKLIQTEMLGIHLWVEKGQRSMLKRDQLEPFGMERPNTTRYHAHPGWGLIVGG